MNGDWRLTNVNVDMLIISDLGRLEIGRGDRVEKQCEPLAGYSVRFLPDTFRYCHPGSSFGPSVEIGDG